MRHRRRRGPDLFVLAIWALLAVASVLLAGAVVRPIWDMTAWVG